MSDLTHMSRWAEWILEHGSASNCHNYQEYACGVRIKDPSVWSVMAGTHDMVCIVSVPTCPECSVKLDYLLEKGPKCKVVFMMMS